ncbi:MAG: DUF3006 domain-containing protein [Deinococcota bacterium]|nr:DUF3006 domain-containing protein [Deinococcota bacterium]
MTLRYNVLYVGEHPCAARTHIEAENGMVHEVPLEWLPVDIQEGQLLLVNPDSIDGIILGAPRTKLAVLEDNAESFVEYPVRPQSASELSSTLTTRSTSAMLLYLLPAKTAPLSTLQPRVLTWHTGLGFA